MNFKIVNKTKNTTKFIDHDNFIQYGQDNLKLTFTEAITVCNLKCAQKFENDKHIITKQTNDCILSFSNNDYCVIAKIESVFDNIDDVIVSLKASITKWINETKEGSELYWGTTGEDLNISDLASYGITKDLKNHMYNFGIHKFEFLNNTHQVDISMGLVNQNDLIEETICEKEFKDLFIDQQNKFKKWEENSKSLEQQAEKIKNKK